MATLKQIIDIVSPDWCYPFEDRDLFEDISVDKLSFNSKGLVADGVEIVCERPRLAFAMALGLYNEPLMKYQLRNGSLFTFCDSLELPIHPPPIASCGPFDEIGFKHGSNCVIGSSGFGYERDENGIPVRMPHLGNVVIGENVEIGSNVCVDRAVIGSTVIGDNVKIDNLVHVAHGAKIGKNTLIVAGAVIGGSVDIGENCFIGMNASIKNKVKIGNNVTIGAGAVVLKDVPDGETWIGNPAKKLEKKSVGGYTFPNKKAADDFIDYMKSNAKEVPMPINDYKDSAHDDLASK